jgi:hypothetical protein
MYCSAVRHAQLPAVAHVLTQLDLHLNQDVTVLRHGALVGWKGLGWGLRYTGGA